MPSLNQEDSNGYGISKQGTAQRRCARPCRIAANELKVAFRYSKGVVSTMRPYTTYVASDCGYTPYVASDFSDWRCWRFAATVPYQN